jgi:hypothetical protein
LTSLPERYDEAGVFDDLQLKAALAEIFMSLGIEGENAWRVAARVRILLVHRDLSLQTRVHTKEFWGDPDVRWLAGISESAGRTYVNKELFEELTVWLQLPELLEIGMQTDGVTESMAAVDESVAEEFSTMHSAGYDLNSYLESWSAAELEVDEVLSGTEVIPEKVTSSPDASVGRGIG